MKIEFQTLPENLDGFTPNWAPFLVLPRGEKTLPPRLVSTSEGLGDRLRTAAFAEYQAYYAFLFAAQKFTTAPDSLRSEWRGLVMAEERHLMWLLNRMEQLGISITERAVSDTLWVSLMNCTSGKEFEIYIASAEERGRRAALKIQHTLSKSDPITAKIFGNIAEEEVEHVNLALRYFPEEARPKIEKNHVPYQ